METKSPTDKKVKQKAKLTFKCQHCGAVLSAKKSLTRHIKQQHDGQNSKIGSKKEGEKVLTPPEEAFCQLYASDREFFGNGVQSYIEAYQIIVGKNKKNGEQSYEYCRYMAHKLLTRANILRRINEIFEARGLNDTFVDKQLEKLITQDAEFRPKLGAIQEYNKLKKRTADTVQHIHAFSDISQMSDEELAKEEERLQNFFKKK